MSEPDHNDKEIRRSMQRDGKLQLLNREFKSMGFFTRGKILNKREGITGNVFLGFLKEEPVVIKMIDDFDGADLIGYFYKERSFLFDQEKKPLSISLEIPNLNLNAQVRFSKLVPEIMNSPFLPADVMVSKFAPPISLEGDIDLPTQIHLIAWLAWTKMLDQLIIDGHKYVMDSQPDDLKLSFHQTDRKNYLDIVKIDCVPVFCDDGAERDICWQIVDNMREILGDDLPTSIKNMDSMHSKPRRLLKLINILGDEVSRSKTLTDDEVKRMVNASNRKINEHGEMV